MPLRRSVPALLVPVLLTLLLAGCESPADRALRASPDFKAGYNDGCASAGTQGANARDTSLDRDEEAYRSNKAYRTGWGTGFNGCRAYQPQANQPRDEDHSPIADPNPGSP